MISKTSLVRTGICLLFLCMITIQMFLVFDQYMGNGMDNNGTTPMSLWWLTQFAGTESLIMIDTLQLIIFTCLGSACGVYMKNNQFFTFVHQRIGYKRFLKSLYMQSFIAAFSFSVITNVYSLILFSVLCKQMPSFVKIDDLLINTAFQDNTLPSWLVFVLMSALGWGIYAILICSIGLFIRKNSVYLVSGAIIGTLLIVVPAMLIFNDSLRYLFSIVILPSLLVPGQVHFFQNFDTPPNVFLIFIFAASLYVVISSLIAKKWIKAIQTHG